MTPTTRSLPVKLTSDERAIRAKALAEKVREARKLDDDRKANASDFKAKIDAISEQITALANTVDSGEEHRQVSVSTYMNFERKVVETIREDTGEPFEWRPMTEGELQRPLPLQMPKLPEGHTATAEVGGKKQKIA